MQKKATSFRIREDALDKLRVMAFVESRSQSSMLQVLVNSGYEGLRMRIEPERLRQIELHVLGHEPLT